MPIIPDAPILVVFVLGAVAIATVMLYSPTAGTALVWTAALVPWATILILRAPAQPWLPGLTAGLAAGVATGLVLFAFRAIYIANHPADATSATFFGLVGFSTVAGLAWGLIAAALAWGVKRVFTA